MREVTHMCWYPGQPDLLVVGGFNGEMRIYDKRNLKETPVNTVKVADGGLWRISPKRFKNSGVRFAVATCSENAFLVLDDSQNFEAVSRVVSSPDSWAYGIDWDWADGSKVLMGCSFYDQSTYLFNSN